VIFSVPLCRGCAPFWAHGEIVGRFDRAERPRTPIANRQSMAAPAWGGSPPLIARLILGLTSSVHLGLTLLRAARPGIFPAPWRMTGLLPCPSSGKIFPPRFRTPLTLRPPHRPRVVVAFCSRAVFCRSNWSGSSSIFAPPVSHLRVGFASERWSAGERAGNLARAACSGRPAIWNRRPRGRRAISIFLMFGFADR